MRSAPPSPDSPSCRNAEKLGGEQLQYDDFVQSEIASGPDPDRRLVNRGPNFFVGVKTWGEILDENNARLQFVRHALEHNADDGQALAFLEERHREFLEGVVIHEAADAADDEEPIAAVADVP